MSFTKKTRQRILSLIAVASMLQACVGMSAIAAEEEIDCSQSVTESGVYSLGDIGEIEGNAFSLDEFKEMLDENIGHTVICTFENMTAVVPESNNSSTWIDTFNLKYGENAEKHIAVTQTANYDDSSAKKHSYKGFNIVAGNQGTGSTTSGNYRVRMLYENENCGSIYTFSFAPGVGGESLEVVKAVGLSSLGKNANVKIVARYVSITTGQDAGSSELICGGRANTMYSSFAGFEAPDNCYIAKLEFYSTGVFMYVDDLALITQEVSEDTTTISRLELIVPDIVETPSYASTLEYNYSVTVFDQFSRECDGEIVLSVDNDDVAEFTEGGKLIIKQQTDMPDTITVSAYAVNAPEVTAEKVITVDKTYSPYYNESKIGVDANVAYDAEKYEGLSERTEYTLEEFTAAMENATVTDGKDIAMINFESSSEEINPDKIKVPLLKDKSKYFEFVSVTRNFSVKRIVDGLQEGSTRKLLPPSGTHFMNLVPAVSGENNYSFDTTLTGNYRVTSLGFVYLGSGSNINIVSDGFGVHVTFSDGTQKTYGTDQIKGGQGLKDENTFYGIKAPAGHYITRCLITMQPRAWAMLDNLGFIFEEPDILTLKPDFEAFTFSSFCSQDMKNITQSINLPFSTSGGCSVSYSTNEPSVLDVTSGAITVPDLAENSNVRLSAAMTYGALTHVRNFDLYVPSKLERDYKRISIPEKTKEDITLPRTGSEFGSTITWKSLNTELIDDNGKVTRPEGQRAKYCVLQATLTNASGSLVKEFGVTVEGTGNEESSNANSVIGSVSSNIANGNNSGIVASSGGGGGGGGAAKPPVPVEVKPSVDDSQTTENTTFADVSKEHWAHDSIEMLYEKGIVNGTGETSFSPEKTVTREQYLSMLVRAFDFTAENADAEFSDVEKDSWYFDAVAVAQSLGICGGYEDGSFGIGKEITREEMAVMAYRSALLAQISVDASDENIEWKDSGEISHFAYDAVAALNNAGIIKGISEDKFSPKTTTTRAQAAVIIQRLLNAVK